MTKQEADKMYQTLKDAAYFAHSDGFAELADVETALANLRLLISKLELN
jgi:hypothetical protein